MQGTKAPLCSRGRPDSVDTSGNSGGGWIVVVLKKVRKEENLRLRGETVRLCGMEYFIGRCSVGCLCLGSRGCEMIGQFCAFASNEWLRHGKSATS
jgi:hypothetical protein